MTKPEGMADLMQYDLIHGHIEITIFEQPIDVFDWLLGKIFYPDDLVGAKKRP